MKVYIITREIQNNHGYVDTDLLDAFTTEAQANAVLKGYEDADLEDGENVEGREEEWNFNSQSDDWTVSYKVQVVTLFRAPQTSEESQTYIDTGELPTVEVK